jgi:hypothetical protein
VHVVALFAEGVATYSEPVKRADSALCRQSLRNDAPPRLSAALVDDLEITHLRDELAGVPARRIQQPVPFVSMLTSTAVASCIIGSAAVIKARLDARLRCPGRPARSRCVLPTPDGPSNAPERLSGGT